jgi:hypothetical protein
MLFKYCMLLGIIAKADAYIFPSKKFDKPISAATVEKNFKLILHHLNIVTNYENPHKRGPCLHCLRHCFMLKSFKQLKKTDMNLIYQYHIYQYIVVIIH